MGRKKAGSSTTKSSTLPLHPVCALMNDMLMGCQALLDGSGSLGAAANTSQILKQQQPKGKKRRKRRHAVDLLKLDPTSYETAWENDSHDAFDEVFPLNQLIRVRSRFADFIHTFLSCKPFLDVPRPLVDQCVDNMESCFDAVCRSYRVPLAPPNVHQAAPLFHLHAQPLQPCNQSMQLSMNPPQEPAAVQPSRGRPLPAAPLVPTTSAMPYGVSKSMNRSLSAHKFDQASSKTTALPSAGSPMSCSPVLSPTAAMPSSFEPLPSVQHPSASFISTEHSEFDVRMHIAPSTPKRLRDLQRLQGSPSSTNTLDLFGEVGTHFYHGKLNLSPCPSVPVCFSPLRKDITSPSLSNLIDFMSCTDLGIGGCTGTGARKT